MGVHQVGVLWQGVKGRSGAHLRHTSPSWGPKPGQSTALPISLSLTCGSFFYAFLRQGYIKAKTVTTVMSIYYTGLTLWLCRSPFSSGLPVSQDRPLPLLLEWGK